MLGMREKKETARLCSSSKVSLPTITAVIRLLEYLQTKTEKKETNDMQCSVRTHCMHASMIYRDRGSSVKGVLLLQSDSEINLKETDRKETEKRQAKPKVQRRQTRSEQKDSEQKGDKEKRPKPQNTG